MVGGSDKKFLRFLMGLGKSLHATSIERRGKKGLVVIHTLLEEDLYIVQLKNEVTNGEHFSNA